MSSIDERVVQMQFENSQFEKGIKETIKSLGLLKQNLNVDKATESIEHLQNVGNSFSLSNISRSLDKIVERTSWAGRTIRREIDLLTSKAVNLGKSLTVGQINAGWSKYEQKTASVQTIMNATGKSIDEVNGYLDKLMWFSDETSYNFTEMTAALGTLTSSGGDINKMIPMIEGMATATAFAGKSASEFSRVIYNLNQSYSQGYLSLMDWKSVELAQVGSEQLKQTLIDTAVELGTLKKLADGTFETKKGTVVNAGNMGSTLNEKWATKEVMEGAFGKFAQVIEEAYKLVEAGEFDTAADAIASLADKYDETYYKAAKAAQEAKSFKEAIDATADAVSSGWMKTFELIFGNYDEARVLWTDLANALWEVFASGAEQRNEVLQAWKDAGGRADLIQGITDALTALWTVIQSIGEAFHDIFPQATADDLLNFSSKVKELGANLRDLARAFEIVSAKRGELVTKTNPLQEYFGDLSNGSRGNEVKKLQEALEAKGFSVGKHGIDGIFGKDTEAALKAFQESIGETADGLYKESDHAKLVGTITASNYELVFETIKKYTPFVDKLQRLARGIFTIFGMVGDAIGFAGKALWNVLSILSPVANAFLTLMAAAGDGIVAFREWVKSSGKFDEWLSSINRKLKQVKQWFEDAGKSILEFFGFDAAGKKIDGVSKFANTLANVKTFLQPVLDWFSTAYKDIKKFFGIGAEMYENGELVPDRGPIPFVQKLTEIKEKLRPVLDWFVGIRDKIKGFFGIGQEVYENGELKTPKAIIFWEKIKNALSGVGEFLKNFISNIPSYWSTLKDFFTNLWEKLNISDRFGGIIDQITSLFPTIKETLGNIGAAIKNAFTGSIGTAAERFGNVISTVWDGIKKIYNEIGPDIVNKIFKVLLMFAGLKGGFGIAKGIKNFAQLILDISGIFKGFSDLGENVGGVFKSITDIFKGFSGLGEGVTDAVKNWDTKVKDIIKAKQKAQPMAKSILQIAAAFALIAASIYVLGNMEPNKLKQGEKVALMIAGGIMVFMLATTIFGKVKDADFSIGKAVLKMAAGLLLITGVIFIFGHMDKNTIAQGMLAMGFILIELGVFLIAMKKFGSTTTNYKGLFAMAAAMLVISFAIKKLGKMDTGELAKGVIVVGLMVAIFASFMKSMKMHGSFETNYKGLLAMAAALGVMAWIVRSLGKLKMEVLAKGLGSLFLITLMMRLIINSMAKMSSKGSAALKFGGLIGFAIMLGVLGLIVKGLGQLKIGVLLKGLGSLFVMILMVNLLIKTASKVSDKGTAKIILKFGGLAAVLGLMAHMVKVLGNTDLPVLAKGLGALVVIMGLLALVMKVGGKAVQGSDFTSFAGMLIVFAGFIYVFAQVLKQIKDVDPLVMVSFAGALGLALVSLAAACKIAGKAGFKGMTKGAASIGLAIAILVGIVGSLMWGIGKLSGGTGIASTIESAIPVLTAIGKCIDTMMSSSFGYVIGAITGVSLALAGLSAAGINVSTLKAMGDAALISLTIGTVMTVASGIFTAMGSINYDNQWATTIESSLPVIESVSKAVTELCGSPLGWATAAITGMSEFIGAFGWAGVKGLLYGTLASVVISGTVGLVMGIGAAIFTAFGSINEAKNGEWAKTIEDGIPVFEAIGRAIGAFIGAIKGESIVTMTKQLESLEDVGLSDDKMTQVVELAGEFRDFYDKFEKVTMGWVIQEWVTNLLGADSPFGKFCKGIGQFANTIATYGASIEVIPDKIDTKTKTAIKAAKKIKELYDTFEQKGFFEAAWDGLADLVAGGSEFENFCNKDIGAFAMAMNTYGTEISKINTDIEANTTTALKAAKAIAGFINGLSKEGDNYIKPSNGGIKAWISGSDNSSDTFLNQVEAFAEELVNLQSSISGLSTSSIESDVTMMTTVAGILAGFFHELSLGSENTENASDYYDSASNAIYAFIAAVSDFKTAMNGFGEAIGKVEPLKMFSVALGLKAIMDEATKFNGNRDAVDAIDNIAYLINSMASMDETDFDFSSIAGICKSMVNEFTSHRKDFVLAGWQFGMGISEGLRTSKELAVSAAAAIARSILNTVRRVLDEHSPSKAAAKMGAFFGEGLADGISGTNEMVSKSGEDAAKSALKSMKNILGGMNNLIDFDMNTDPVIRPIVDLSDVKGSSRIINGMFARSNLISVNASIDKAEAAYSSHMISKNVQNESRKIDSGSSESGTDTSVNLSGNNFYIRSEQDIRSLASEIATLTKQQQRSLGATY